MAREVGRLTALEVKRKKAPGRYPDGGGLYLQVTGDGAETVAKSWLYRFMRQGKERWMGLGPAADIPLADARQRAAACRKVVRDGIDPIAARDAEREQAALAEASATTFKECAEHYIAGHETTWRSGKHRAQWKSTLATYAYPVIGTLSIQAIDTGLVLKVLEPIWKTKPETANRLRGRIEAILDWAAARKYRQGENPARWRGHLDKVLPRRSRVRKVRHHPALPYEQTGAFMQDLRKQEGIAAEALELTILTCDRSGEIVGAKPAEFDVTERVWTVPAGRMKGYREHRVPLSAAALAIVKKRLEAGAEWMFPGRKQGKHMSNMAMAMLLRRMKRPDGAPWTDRHGAQIVPHGFRSTFRDWAAERTNFPSEVAEMAIAHAVDDEVEAAYRRGDLFEKRRRLAEAWASFCAAPPKAGQVVLMRATSR